MKFDGVSGTGNGNFDGVNAQGEKTPEDYEKVDVKNSSKLAEHLAGLTEDLNGDNGIIQNILADGVVDDSEKAELNKWQQYVANLGSEANRYFQTIKQTATDEVFDAYSNIIRGFSALKKRITGVMNSKAEPTDSEQHLAKQLRWSSAQTRIKMKFDSIMQLSVEHPRAAASQIENLIARYQYNPNSDDDGMLSFGQQAILSQIQNSLNERADKELDNLRNQTKTEVGSTFFDREGNGEAYAKTMKEHGHSHDLRADLGVVLPEDEQ